MIFNYSTVRIAYHAYVMREDGLWYVQYGYEAGEVLWEVKVRDYKIWLTGVSSW